MLILENMNKQEKQDMNKQETGYYLAIDKYDPTIDAPPTQIYRTPCFETKEQLLEGFCSMTNRYVYEAASALLRGYKSWQELERLYAFDAVVQYLLWFIIEAAENQQQLVSVPRRFSIRLVTATPLSDIPEPTQAPQTTQAKQAKQTAQTELDKQTEQALTVLQTITAAMQRTASEPHVGFGFKEAVKYLQNPNSWVKRSSWGKLGMIQLDPKGWARWLIGNKMYRFNLDDYNATDWHIADYPDTFGFSDALVAMKRGHSVRRLAWIKTHYLFIGAAGDKFYGGDRPDNAREYILSPEDVAEKDWVVVEE